MSSKQTDLEYEMSRFEEEITKLNQPTVVSRPPVHISAPPVHSITIKPIINQQIYQQQSAYTAVQPTSFIPQQLVNRPTVPHVSIPVSSTASTSANAGGGVKRDASVLGTDSNDPKAKKGKKQKRFVRMAGGQKWEDDTLNDWDPDDFRLFCGDLGNEVTDEMLTRAFSKYTSFQKAKVVRDKRTSKSKGYGFVSFNDSQDFIKAMREMNGKYVGNRPIKLKKSNWSDRNLDVVKKKEIEKVKMGLK